MTLLEEHALQIFRAAIDAVTPARLVSEAVHREGDLLHIGTSSLSLASCKRILVIGAGKVSSQMARALEDILGSRITAGLVTTKYGHGVSCSCIRVVEAGHPVPDENTLHATGRMLDLVRSAGEQDLILCLLSGGGSALLELLPEGISLGEFRRTNELLLRSGATIEEINAVRKHLSRVKGGQLARIVGPATCVSLILSDVVGDSLQTIASGPTAPDTTTFADALEVVRRHGIESRLPGAILEYLQGGSRGRFPETLKAGDPVFEQVWNVIVGNSMMALRAAEEKARALGYTALVLTSRMQGEAREAARFIAGIIQEIRLSDIPCAKPACVLLGGETTVTVRGRGTGGRNQELALASLLAMEGTKGDYLIASCGTDGTDGPTEAAGALASPAVLERAVRSGLQAGKFLAENDSFTFWKKVEGLVVTGPTGTNVMDVVIALVPR